MNAVTDTSPPQAEGSASTNYGYTAPKEYETIFDELMDYMIYDPVI